jgi:hypothetical protein
MQFTQYSDFTSTRSFAMLNPPASETKIKLIQKLDSLISIMLKYKHIIRKKYMTNWMNNRNHYHRRMGIFDPSCRQFWRIQHNNKHGRTCHRKSQADNCQGT